MILILTNEEDITTDFVVKELRAGEFLRVNTERLPVLGTLSYEYDGQRLNGEIQFESTTISLANITSVYCRRVRTPALDDVFDSGVRNFARLEFQSMLQGLAGLLTARWVNHPAAVHRAESKLLQLERAQRSGLVVPKTLVTNDPVRARNFAAALGRPLVVKPLSSSRLTVAGEEQIIFTSRVPSDIDVFADLPDAPCIIQEQIHKKCDLRVTVVGNEIFAAEIDSQQRMETQVDWRASGGNDLDHRRHKLPDSVADASIRLCRDLDLAFGALDFAIDNEGRHVFFEVNPNGQWGWIQALTGAPISGAIARLLRAK